MAMLWLILFLGLAVRGGRFFVMSVTQSLLGEHGLASGQPNWLKPVEAAEVLDR